MCMGSASLESCKNMKQSGVTLNGVPVTDRIHVSTLFHRGRTDLQEKNLSVSVSGHLQRGQLAFLIICSRNK